LPDSIRSGHPYLLVEEPHDCNTNMHNAIAITVMPVKREYFFIKIKG